MMFGFALAAVISGWTATQFVDTGNAVFLGISIAAGLTAVGNLFANATDKIVEALKESNHGDGRAR